MTEREWTKEDEERVVAENQHEKKEWAQALKHASALKHFLSQEGQQRTMGGYDSDLAKAHPWMEDIFDLIQGRLEGCFERDRDAALLDEEEDQTVNP